jgi:vitamin B12 transporter
MSAVLVRSLWCSAVPAFFLMLIGIPAVAQSQNVLRGRVNDPVGKSVPNAKVVVLQDGREVAHATSNADGAYELSVPNGGRYDVQVEAEGFAAATVPAIFVAAGKSTEVPTVALAIGPLAQNVVVSATGTPIPDSQVGASISVIDGEQIETLNKLDVLENLRLVPGAQVVQTSQRGGATSLFGRGGNSDFNKILVDGIPVNQIGGAFDFAQLSNNGVGNLEILRGSNSVLYGSDALSSVVSITSTRG